MKASKKCFIVFVLLASLMLHTSVYAADALCRFMHNDHIALIIGEIVRVEEEYISVRVEKNIISSKDLNANAPKKQKKISNADVSSSFKYGLYNEDDSKAKPSLGDYVLMSLTES